MKSLIFVIFYQEVPLQSTVAGVSAATNYTGLSCTKHNKKPVLMIPSSTSLEPPVPSVQYHCQEP